MFESISEKLDSIFKKLKGRGLLKEEDVEAALKEVRLALLEADVNFKVVKDLIQKIKAKAVGNEVLESLTPGQQVV
jgi:signal recognition particle subunit SRP54